MTQKTPPIALEDRASDGARLSSPSAARNREPIMSALGERLPDGARVLEIASGTGEHALAVVSARPDLRWTPSDPDPKSRASENAWAEDAEGRIRPALDLDVCAPGWWDGLESVEAIYCANMIHIAPWQAAEGLFDGASKLLTPEAPCICMALSWKGRTRRRPISTLTPASSSAIRVGACVRWRMWMRWRAVMAWNALSAWSCRPTICC